MDLKLHQVLLDIVQALVALALTFVVQGVRVSRVPGFVGSEQGDERVFDVVDGELEKIRILPDEAEVQDLQLGGEMLTLDSTELEDLVALALDEGY